MATTGVGGVVTECSGGSIAAPVEKIADGPVVVGAGLAVGTPAEIAGGGGGGIGVVVC